MSKPIEGGMSGTSEQLSDLCKGSESLGAEIARRTTTTIIPARSGFELLSLECAGEVCRRPIVGWAVVRSEPSDIPAGDAIPTASRAEPR
jgi:hypothetical protein